MEEWVRYVEYEWSRFRKDNELDRLNQLKVGEEMSLSDPLFDVLKQAEAFRKKTRGLFSPYLSLQMQYHGYEQSFPFDVGSEQNQLYSLVSEEEQPPFLINSKNQTVLRVAEGQIDLGGIGKGYTVQAAAQWLKNIGRSVAGIVDGGGDITVWSDGSRVWRIGVSDPYHNEEEFAHFNIKNGGIATSNVIFRGWMQGSIRKHHILNGQTGIPADNGIIQATVISNNLLEAEVGAKVSLMVDQALIKNHLQKLNLSCSYLLVSNQGRILTG
ncbi:FAD:protein FMN transferase [Neobacillus sp. PS2-9]|uniref:FAD:protein FMN transferase n=1 Tax=Neobacillus sp. PS2-9 TaxID=3070676 RepID=UPI0027DF8A77|nr:FAD:protein FMN transferase [Neobacillus sp. PS2-9]WML60270.1 FAD:protein FMN transferase [Neobacillus sp. PS2-9]